MKETTYAVHGCPVKIALLADFHNGSGELVLLSLRKRKPELICVCGDVVYGSKPLAEQKNVLPLLRGCVEIAPTFLSLGNHEQGLTSREIREIRRTGTIVLDNKRREMNGIVIGGLTSGHVMRRRKGTEGPDTKWLKKFAAEEGYHILLSHHPEYLPLVPEGIELILCGHAHGGQIRLFNHGLFAPGQGWWPKYTRGLYDGRMIVSAGLTNTARYVPRLFNPREIVYIEGL